MEAKTISLTYHITERHGYIEVSLSLLRKLKISKLISEYSKTLRRTVFVEEDGSYLCRFGTHTFCFNDDTCNMNEICEETLRSFFENISQIMEDVDYFNDVYSPLHLLFHDGIQTYRGFELLKFDYISSRFNVLDI